MRGLKASDTTAERGAVLPLVALSMVVIIGMAALVIDLGGGWTTRRSLIPAADAAALAAAQDFADPSVGAGVPCGVTAPGYVTLNEPGATMDSCVPFAYSASQGRVTVSVSETVNTFFAPVLGLGDYTVTAESTAVWGPPLSVTGLRPIGVCYFSNPGLQDIINNPPSGPTEVTVVYGSSSPAACGDVPGNWGMVDFAFDGGNTTQRRDEIINGYDGEVSFENHLVTSCTGEPHCYGADTGAVAPSIASALAGLRDSGEYFAIPVFNFSELQGSNALYHMMGILRVRLIDFRLTGNQQNRYFTFSVMPGLVTGTCCGPPGGGGGNSVIAICGVDPGAYTACDPS